MLTGEYSVIKHYGTVSTDKYTKYDPTEVWYQINFDGKPVGPSFQVIKNKVASTYGGDVVDFQTPIAQKLHKLSIKSNTI